jgi:hypothetical protein
MLHILIQVKNQAHLQPCLKAWAWQTWPRSDYAVWVLNPASESLLAWPKHLQGGFLDLSQTQPSPLLADSQLLLWDSDFRPHRDLVAIFETARQNQPQSLFQAVATWPPEWLICPEAPDLASAFFQPDTAQIRLLSASALNWQGLYLPTTESADLLKELSSNTIDAPQKLQQMAQAKNWQAQLVPTARATCYKRPSAKQYPDLDWPVLPATPHSPLRVLIGPLPDPALLGDYLYGDQIKTFTSLPHSRLLAQAADYPPEAYDLAFDLKQDDFEDLLAQLSPDWQPDLILWLAPAVQGLPPGFEKSQIPIVALVHDWHSQGLATLLDCAQAFDQLFCDQALLKLLQAQGIQNADYWPCYGLDPERSYALPDLQRKWDLGFVGTWASAYYPEREQSLQQMALLGHRYRVLLSDGISDPHAYNRLLNQCKIVLNPTARGEMNLRAYEAPAAGALLLSEAANLEIPAVLPPNQASLFYTPDTLEQMITQNLDSGQHQNLAKNGWQTIQKQTYTAHFGQLLSKLKECLPTLQASRKSRTASSNDTQQIWIQARQLYFSRTPAAQARGLFELTQARQAHPQDSLLKYTQALFWINNALDFFQAEAAGQAGEPLWQRISENQKQLFQTGIKSLQELALQLPQNPFLPYHLGWIMAYLQDYVQARFYLQKALALPFPAAASDPYYRLILPLGHSSVQIPHFQMEYGRRLQALLQTQSDDAWPLQALIMSQIAQIQGHALYSERQYSAALLAYQQALKLYPHSPELKYLQAQTLQCLKRGTEAEQVLKQLVSQHPLSFPYRWEWLKCLERNSAQGLKTALQACETLFNVLEKSGQKEMAQIHRRIQEWLSELA